MPSHALKEPFTRTSEDRVTMLHSMLLIIFLWITRKQALSVYVALLVSSSILSDIHHGIRIFSLHASRYRHWGFLSFSSLQSVGEK